MAYYSSTFQHVNGIFNVIFDSFKSHCLTNASINRMCRSITIFQIPQLQNYLSLRKRYDFFATAAVFVVKKHVMNVTNVSFQTLKAKCDLDLNIHLYLKKVLRVLILSRLLEIAIRLTNLRPTVCSFNALVALADCKEEGFDQYVSRRSCQWFCKQFGLL